MVLYCSTMPRSTDDASATLNFNLAALDFKYACTHSSMPKVNLRNCDPENCYVHANNAKQNLSMFMFDCELCPRTICLYYHSNLCINCIESVYPKQATNVHVLEKAINSTQLQYVCSQTALPCQGASDKCGATLKFNKTALVFLCACQQCKAKTLHVYVRL